MYVLYYILILNYLPLYVLYYKNYALIADAMLFDCLSYLNYNAKNAYNIINNLEFSYKSIT